MTFARVRLPRIWHPLLVGLIPILSSFESNVQEVGWRELVVPILLTLGVTLGIWALLTWAFKDLSKAALVASAALFLFFNFGTADRWLDFLTEGESAQTSLLKSVGVLLVGIAILTIALRRVLKRPKLLRPLTIVLNGFSVVVVVFLLALATIEATVAGTSRSDSGHGVRPRPGEGTGGNTGVVIETASDPARLPDIYYIILDGYGRSDVLKEMYGYDNREFLEHLRSKGFYVASHSTANYCQTPLSLASSLNGRYHTNLSRNAPFPLALIQAIRDSSVLKTLKRHGYHFVTFETGSLFTNMPDAEVYLSPFRASSSSLLLQGDFQSLLVGKTPLTLYWKARSTSPPSTKDLTDKYALHRQLTLYTLDTLGKIAAQHSPKFVFVHVLAPHPPFLFGEDGEDTSPRELPYFSTDGSYYQDYYGLTADYVRGYRRQCTFISKLAERAIDDILKNSPEPPIIIVQGDHGPGSRWNCNSSDPRDSDLKERMSILNAYYLPGAGSEGLYDSITPVNSFRLVLNNYFGAKLELLPDESYLSSVKQPLLLVNVSPLARPAPGSSAAKNSSSAATRAAP